MKTTNVLVVLTALAVDGSALAQTPASDAGPLVPVEPAMLAPTELPPAPPPQPPPPPNATDPGEQSEVTAESFPQSGQAAGQWVYTGQYGWVFMPYGNQYVDEGTLADPHPYAFVFLPRYGWRWVVSPWVWGWGPYPHFGQLGPLRFGWYLGLFHSGWGWGRYRGGEPSPAGPPAHRDEPHGSRAIGGVRPGVPRTPPAASAQHGPPGGALAAPSDTRHWAPPGSFGAGLAPMTPRPPSGGFGPALGVGASPAMGGGRIGGAAPAGGGGGMSRSNGRR